jgi:hypothetical protein
MCEFVYEAAQTAPAMSFESAITIILAALAVLLTALAIIIGLGAIWGWVGIKEAASKAATDAMNKRMEKYPDPESMADMMSRMEDILGTWDNIKDKLVTGAGTKEVATASNGGVQQEPPVAPPYPGEPIVSTTPTSPEPPAGSPNVDPSTGSGEVS